MKIVDKIRELEFQFSEVRKGIAETLDARLHPSMVQRQAELVAKKKELSDEIIRLFKVREAARAAMASVGAVRAI